MGRASTQIRLAPFQRGLRFVSTRSRPCGGLREPLSDMALRLSDWRQAAMRCLEIALDSCQDLP